MQLINEIIKINPEKIIYVSCNSATQARDLKILKKYYEISKMKIIDMFPQTLHVENVVLLKKLKLLLQVDLVQRNARFFHLQKYLLML